MTRARRLAALEAAHLARPARLAFQSPRTDALRELGRALLLALPDGPRAQVEAQGARGVARLVEGLWETRAAGPDLPGAALTAYRAAFPGGAV